MLNEMQESESYPSIYLISGTYISLYADQGLGNSCTSRHYSGVKLFNCAKRFNRSNVSND